jgi:hypothetical protein
VRQTRRQIKAARNPEPVPDVERRPIRGKHPARNGPCPCGATKDVPDDTPVLVFDMTGDVCPGEPVMMTVPVKFKHCCGAP